MFRLCKVNINDLFSQLLRLMVSIVQLETIMKLFFKRHRMLIWL